MIINQRHLAIHVSNLEKGIEFYTALGGVFSSKDLEKGEFIESMMNKPGVILKTCKILFRDGSRIELIEFLSKFHVSAKQIDFSRIYNLGYHHVAFTVDNLEAAIETVIELGGERIGKTMLAGKNHSIHAIKANHVYMLDPFGNLLHLAQDLK